MYIKWLHEYNNHVAVFNKSNLVDRLDNKNSFNMSLRDWCKSNGVRRESFFDIINEYVVTLPIYQQDELLFLYNDIGMVFNSSSIDMVNVDAKTNLCIDNILRILDYEKFKIWCINNSGALGINLIMPLRKSGEHPEELTYTSDNYIECVIFSILLKALMPIWGGYHELYSEVIGKDFIYIKCLKLSALTRFADIPPFERLGVYVESALNLTVKNNNYIVSSTYSDEDLYDYVLAHSIWKKVVLFDAKDGASLIADIWYGVKYCLRPFVITLINPAGGADNDSDDKKSFYMEKVRAVTRTSILHTERVKHYLRYDNVKNVVNKIDSACSPSDERVENVLRIVHKAPVLKKYQYLLVCGTLKDVVSIGLLSSLDNNSNDSKDNVLLNGIAISAMILQHWGFNSLYRLMISNPRKREEDEQTYHIFNSQSSEDARNLKHLYRYANQEIVEDWVNSVTKEMCNYVYSFDVTNVTIELRKFLLRG